MYVCVCKDVPVSVLRQSDGQTERQVCIIESNICFHNDDRATTSVRINTVQNLSQ